MYKYKIFFFERKLKFEIMNTHHFVAIDLGATSGRVILATIDNAQIGMEEIHRFPDTIIQMQGHFYWDLPAIYKSVIEGLKKVAERGIHIESIGIDTWGVDFAFFSKEQKNCCVHDIEADNFLYKVFLEKQICKADTEKYHCNSFADILN